MKWPASASVAFAATLATQGTIELFTSTDSFDTFSNSILSFNETVNKSASARQYDCPTIRALTRSWLGSSARVLSSTAQSKKINGTMRRTNEIFGNMRQLSSSCELRSSQHRDPVRTQCRRSIHGQVRATKSLLERSSHYLSRTSNRPGG